MSIPTEAEIRVLKPGELIALRSALTERASPGVKPRYLPSYHGMLDDTLALATLLRLREEAQAVDPPRPAWVAELDGAKHHEPNDAVVVARMTELVMLEMSDAEIWNILKTEFSFNANLMETEAHT
jgi:hypothetical protein